MSAVIEQARQERFERELRSCKTPKQRETFTRIHEEGGSAYVGRRAGKTVVQQFKKYSTTMDPKAIDVALYEWSIHDGPGDIAHFNLHGFRSVYPHPAIYYELLLLPWLQEQKRSRWYLPSIYVYTDGMTSHDVRDEIMKLAVQWRARVLETFSQEKKREELSQAEELAAKYGMRLVPVDS
jgi:hypothetical protein